MQSHRLSMFVFEVTLFSFFHVMDTGRATLRNFINPNLLTYQKSPSILASLRVWKWSASEVHQVTTYKHTWHYHFLLLTPLLHSLVSFMHHCKSMRLCLTLPLCWTLKLLCLQLLKVYAKKKLQVCKLRSSNFLCKTQPNHGSCLVGLEHAHASWEMQAN